MGAGGGVRSHDDMVIATPRHDAHLGEAGGAGGGGGGVGMTTW